MGDPVLDGTDFSPAEPASGSGCETRCGSVAKDPVEGRGVGSEVAPSSDRRGVGEQGIARAEHRHVVARLDLDQATHDRDQND